jgi:hypothetical protein
VHIENTLKAANKFLKYCVFIAITLQALAEIFISLLPMVTCPGIFRPNVFRDNDSFCSIPRQADIPKVLFSACAR